MEEKILKALARVTETAEGALTAAEENAVVMHGVTLLMPFALAGQLPSERQLAEMVALSELSPAHSERVLEWLRAVVRNASILRATAT